MTHWQPPDLDEIRPDRFVINNAKVQPLLKGEGVIVGKFFDLVTWRREGLIARIRERGFNVRTIRDRIERLPAIKPVEPLGDAGVRKLGTPKERIATFQHETLHWRDLPVETENTPSIVRVRAGAALRRRKSRGLSDYYIATLAHDMSINLLPVKEADALLHAYAQIAQSGPPATVRFHDLEDAYLVPERQLILPQPHQDALNMLVRDKTDRWTIPHNVSELAEMIFAKLGIELQPQA